MNKQIIFKVVFILLLTFSICCISVSKTTCNCPKCAAARQEKVEKANELDTVLKQLHEKTSELTSFQAQIEYKF